MTTTVPPTVPSGLYDGVVGQDRAIRQLRAAAVAPVHAYLLVGPPGTGMPAAARSFAASLLCPAGGDGTCRTCRLTLAGEHPDVVTFEPEGAFLSIRDDVPEIIRLANRSPVEGERKVLILTDFERVERAGPALLKTIEEPPASTVFVVLAAHVPAELVTIASRCVRVDFAPVPRHAVVEALVAEGSDPDRAEAAAAAAGGSLDRARLLVTDRGLEDRRRVWLQVPQRLDGTGAAVAVVAGELVQLIAEAALPLDARQAGEVASLEERIERYGERGSGRKRLEARHKREQRRHRTDELRFGLATLAARYRDALADGTGGTAALDALTALQDAAAALPRNPNETLLLQALLLRLPHLPAAGG